MNNQSTTEAQEELDSKQYHRETTRVRTEIIDKEVMFYALEEEWNHLACLADVPVFVSFDWLFCWWRHFGQHPKRKLSIMVVSRGDQMIGIAPFYRGKSSLGSFTLQKRLHLMGSGVSKNELLGFADDYGYSDFLDVIAHPDYEEAVAVAVANTLLENKIGADVICFQHVNDESFMIRKILPCLSERHQRLTRVQTDECPYIDLPDSIETYLEEIGSSSRRRRFRNNLKPAGVKYEVEEASTLEDVKRGVELLHSLHQQRWHTLGYPGLFFDSRYYHFFQEISKVAFQNGWLWFKMAKDEKGYVATRWALKYNNRFFDCTSGFDASAPSSKYSPGLGLLALLIDNAIEVNASRVEMLRGTERYKFDFTKKSQYNWRISLPLYWNKSWAATFRNKLIEGAGKIFSILKNEIQLLQTHRQKTGLLRMVSSYASFRLERLRSKLANLNVFSKKNNSVSYE